MAQTPMVQVENLVKVYPNGVRAVDGIDFTVMQGEFVGFLGPNGAGKSTTMKVLSTLLKKTSGRVTVAGHDVDKDPMAVRKSIGFAMQEVGLDDLARGMDFLVMQGALYGQSQKEAHSRAEELLELVGLTSVAKRKVGTYSGGMRRRIDLVSALIHHPPLLFLDEPTTGLDPQSRIALWKYLQDINRQGITIFLSTQLMEEADRLCQRLYIIDMGKLVAQGTPGELKEDVGGDVITISVDSRGQPEHKAELEKAKVLTGERSYVSEAQILEDSLIVKVRNGSSSAPDLLKLLYDNGVSVANMSVSSPTLDDVFLKYTGHKIRTESTGGDEMGQAMRPWLGLSSKR